MPNRFSYFFSFFPFFLNMGSFILCYKEKNSMYNFFLILFPFQIIRCSMLTVLLLGLFLGKYL